MVLKYSIQFIVFTVHQSVFQKNCFCVIGDLIVFLVPDLIWSLFWISLSLLICIWSKSLRFLHNSLNHLLLTIFQKTTWQFTVSSWILIWFSVHWFSRFYICLQYTDSVWLVLIFVNCLNLCRLYYKFLLRICILTLKSKLQKKNRKRFNSPPPPLELRPNTYFNMVFKGEVVDVEKIFSLTQLKG